jgi:hypothetical protein
LTGSSDNDLLIIRQDTAQIPNGIKPINNPLNISVYPNPSNSVFTVSMKNENERIKDIEVFNVLGENVYSQFNIPDPTFKIDLSSQADGIYFLRALTEDGQMLTQKVSIIK